VEAGRRISTPNIWYLLEENTATAEGPHSLESGKPAGDMYIALAYPRKFVAIVHGPDTIYSALGEYSDKVISINESQFRKDSTVADLQWDADHSALSDWYKWRDQAHTAMRKYLLGD